MANIQKRQIVSTNGDYDVPIIPGRKYAFEIAYTTGTGTFTAKQVFKYSEGSYAQTMMFPNGTTDAAITATGTLRGFGFTATGDIFRLTLAFASSLVAVISFWEIPHGR